MSDLPTNTRTDILPDTVHVPLPDEGFYDARGRIQNLLLRPINSVARITSRAGTVRANHYHKTDWHYAFVESGCIEYHWAPLDDLTKVTISLHRPGDMFFSPPMVAHAMVFPEDTVFYTFAQNIRSHDNHESDVVRVELVSPSAVAKRYGF